MRKRTFLIYTTYIWLKTLLGLTFHPYLSVRETIKYPILFPVVLTPFFGIILLFIAVKIGSLLVIVYGLKRELIALFLSTTLLSILFWQLLLIYLLSSFLIASWKKKI